MFESLPVHMDYSGQKLAEQIFQKIIVIFGVIGFVIGFASEKLSYSIYILGAGCVLAAIVTLPPWGFYRKDPIKWQKPADDEPTTYSPLPSKTAKAAKKKN
ncbi:signal peptidase complex subunit 1-like [Clavelina lepadiformis]|uniref:Signal peptidase complex subunit 1 n=1 Tax=Clavelina lepadiformis TaxID=159417 RepID=A0ABP0GFK8_CLALP